MESSFNFGVPVVGMGATKLLYSDRAPFTVIWVSPSGKSCKVQADKAIRKDSNGMSEDQDYEFERDPEGEIVTLRLTLDGWAYKRQRFAMGVRKAYHDFGF
jgi:hypothetical protein